MKSTNKRTFCLVGMFVLAASVAFAQEGDVEGSKDHPFASKHGIDAQRLHPVGVGLLSPVTSNKTEEGRAKNRRVELVEQ